MRVAQSSRQLALSMSPNRPSVPRPIGVRQGRKGGNQQPIHASGSALHVMHAVHASGTEQQAAGALDVAKPPFGAAVNTACGSFNCSSSRYLL